MARILTFEEAISWVDGDKKPHVLLGNGFSRACRNDIFAYDSLFNRADFNSLAPEARQAFEVLNTTDFELVMKALRRASVLIELYAGDSGEVVERMQRHADALREVLVQAIATSHPERPSDIPLEKYAACRAFLAHFNYIYSFNYDLLLYWALMQDEIEPALAHDDGFRTPDEGPEEYVTWDVEKTNRQNIHYLHGALHIFDASDKIKKYTWINTGIRLIEQVRSALSANLYPLFVAEGQSERKMERIRHSDWLSRSYRSFANLGGSLFIYGHSLAANDEHILKLLDKGKVKQLFVSVFRDPDAAENRRIIRRVERIREIRTKRRPLDIYFYDAESAKAWG